MSWLSKLFSVSANVVNEKAEKALDSIVDIKREGGAIIRQIDNKASKLRKSVEEAKQQVQLNKDEISSLNKQVIAMNQVARNAVSRGEDTEAAQALGRVELFEATIESLQASNDILEPVIEQQLNYIQTLQAEKRSLEVEIQRMDMEEKSYKLRAQMLGGSEGDFGYNIDDLRNRVKKAKPSVEAKEIISEKLGEDLIKKYSDQPKPSVEAKLDALKQELNKA